MVKLAYIFHDNLQWQSLKVALKGGTLKKKETDLIMILKPKHNLNWVPIHKSASSLPLLSMTTSLLCLINTGLSGK